MHFSIEIWMQEYVKAIRAEFGDRVWLLGLQGSFGRGEGTQSSDIDVVLILDTVSVRDLEQYSKILDALPNRERICGFVSGKAELFVWEPSDLFQFCQDTIPVVGSLDGLMEKIQPDDVHRAVRIGACDVYHACAHNLVHEKSASLLKGLYKSASFTQQAIAYLQTGRYARRKADLLALLPENERMVLQAGLELQARSEMSAAELRQYSGLLLNWASNWIQAEGGLMGQT